MKKNDMLLHKIVIATKNEGKLHEIRDLLSDVISGVLTYKDIDWVSPEETGNTFAQNAFIKAHHVATATGLPALADDSGLCIMKLNGAPNTFSARWAKDGTDFVSGIERIQKELNGSKSKAVFKSVISLCLPNNEHFEFEGTLYGNIVFPSQGPIIGYESIFVPDGYLCSLSSLPEKERQKIHYRTIAINKLKKFITHYTNK